MEEAERRQSTLVFPDFIPCRIRSSLPLTASATSTSSRRCRRRGASVPVPEGCAYASSPLPEGLITASHCSAASPECFLASSYQSDPVQRPTANPVERPLDASALTSAVGRLSASASASPEFLLDASASASTKGRLLAPASATAQLSSSAAASAEPSTSAAASATTEFPAGFSSRPGRRRRRNFAPLRDPTSPSCDSRREKGAWSRSPEQPESNAPAICPPGRPSTPAWVQSGLAIPRA
ncbi:hypothetical protein CRENBAI_022252 [Crenichthys baileyi]|uniref:Uncharacterized protein n=1 Tax=Crenichthys baileyi TaxID=28760 RepID=A0AAV9QPE8_9TELE